MKALILAAGIGSRLRPLTDEKPKSLVEVNGKPILLKQIENLKENGIDDIIIVSGYKGDILEKFVHSFYPEIEIIFSNNYLNTNNMFSAYLASKKLGGGVDFLMMNADVFYDASVIKKLISFESSNAIVVDIGRYMEESMKVIEKDKRIVAISKTIEKKDALGCSIDVYKFSKDGGSRFFTKCKEYIDKNELKMWSEVALNDILKDVEFKACPLDGRWYEIDNHDDLVAAEELFRR